MNIPNHFALFQLPEQFDLDREALDNAYREVQNLAHPDRFINAPDADKRAAMQWASCANDAYQTLRHPIKRAAYLCSLRGFPLDNTSSPAVPPDFIFEQIEWREHLDNARISRDMPELENISAHLHQREKEQLDLIEKALARQDFAAGIQEVRKMMFLQKFRDEISFVLESLDQTN